MIENEKIEGLIRLSSQWQLTSANFFKNNGFENLKTDDQINE